jgi:hypothetical protein
MLSAHIRPDDPCLLYDSPFFSIAMSRGNPKPEPKTLASCFCSPSWLLDLLLLFCVEVEGRGAETLIQKPLIWLHRTLPDPKRPRSTTESRALYR